MSAGGRTSPGGSGDSSHRRRVVAIVGPTAVGKTDVAVRLAVDLRGEVVSIDSRQMVRRLDIGTAKPTAQQRAACRHHLLDVLDPDEPLSLALVQQLAYRAIDGILQRQLLPLPTGGSGQYMRAVLEGWEIPQVPPDLELRRSLRDVAKREGAAALHARLSSIDPVAAARIDPRNVRRAIRALEVFAHTGRPISDLQARRAPRYEALTIGLDRPRDELYARIDARVDQMLAAGLESEVMSLVAAGYGFDLPAMSSVGYAEWADFLAGSIDRAEVVRRIRRNSRRLVRQQATWFRRADPNIAWFDLSSAQYADIRARVERFLGFA